MPREYPRKLRVAAELQRVLNDILHSDIKDPRLKQVSVSEVEISGDVSVAKVFFSTLVPDSDPEPIIAALGKANGYLRSRAAKLLRLRHVPELRFFQDEAAKQGFELTRIIEASAISRNPINDDADFDDFFRDDSN
jgi:ribosome-binding factor A|tara:strand:+ start:28 stop:435 length:408 start_codon:yes stop_codon:yes gene_type:complete